MWEVEIEVLYAAADPSTAIRTVLSHACWIGMHVFEGW